MPRKQIFYIAQSDVLIDRMNSIGPGDEDVNTQSGRTTTVQVKTSAPAPAAGSREVTFTLEYTVSEGRKDNTRLYAKEEVTVQLESGLRFVEFGAGFVNASYKEVIGGQHHNWFDISDRPGIKGSCVQWCNVKIDGKGDDDNGNAQLSAHVAIPLVVDVELQNPSSGGTTTEGSTLLHPEFVPGWITMSEATKSDNPVLRALADSASGGKVIKLSRGNRIIEPHRIPA